MKKVLHKISVAVTVILTALLLWAVISWMDVCMHNSTPSYGELHSWNMFQILVDQVEEE